MSAMESLVKKANELWADLRERNPAILAENTGAKFVYSDKNQEGEFRLLVWGREVILHYPSFSGIDGETGAELDTFASTLLAYYFTNANGVPPLGRWISFNELPDGAFYARAFQGYTGDEMAKVFQDDVGGFSNAAEKLGGEKIPLGDGAYAFQVLPLVKMLVVCWLGDDDFPTSYRVLFDAAAGYHLTTDALAVVGSTLKSRLVKVWMGQN